MSLRRTLGAASSFTVLAALALLAGCAKDPGATPGPCVPGFCRDADGGTDLGLFDGGPTGVDYGPVVYPDLGPPDMGHDYRDAAPVVPCTVACGDTELCGDTGDGLRRRARCAGRAAGPRPPWRA